MKAWLKGGLIGGIIFISVLALQIILSFFMIKLPIIDPMLSSISDFFLKFIPTFIVVLERVVWEVH